MDRYFFEMTAVGWTYHSSPRSSNAGERHPRVDAWRTSDAGEQHPRVDRRFIGSFGGPVVRFDTLPAVRLFLAFYWANVGLQDYEYPSYSLRQHIPALMELMPPPTTFGRHTHW